MFLSSFYCYLKYHSTNDFIIDLDNVWHWLGFGQKVNAKRVLEKNFIINTDYKLLLCQSAKQTNVKGGLFNSDNQLQQEFSCKYDVIRQLKMSDKTLTKALDKNILYNNYYYKSMGSKVKWL